MPKTFRAPFAQSFKTGQAVATAAKTTYNDNVNAVRLLKVGTEGGRLRRVTAIMRATVSATQLQLYRSIDNGATLQLWRTRLMPAYTMSATTEAPLADLGIDYDSPTLLQANEEVWFAIGVALAGGIVATAEWEDYVP